MIILLVNINIRFHIKIFNVKLRPVGFQLAKYTNSINMAQAIESMKYVSPT